jgi:hypothetical protein
MQTLDYADHFQSLLHHQDMCPVVEDEQVKIQERGEQKLHVLFLLT